MKVYAVCYHVFYEDTTILSLHKTKETANNTALEIYQSDLSVDNEVDKSYDNGMIVLTTDFDMYYVKELELEEWN